MTETSDVKPFGAVVLRRVKEAMRANVGPGLILQAFVAAIVLGYFFLPPVRAVLETAAEWKGRYGYAYSATGAVFFGGVLPLLLQRVTKEGRRRSFFAELRFAIPFWTCVGLLVDALYRFLGWLLGDDPTPSVVLTKVVLDQFVFSIPLVIVLMVLLEWKELGYNLDATRRLLGRRWYVDRVLPVQIASWVVWLPAVAVIYSLKPTLQFPVQNLIQSFWALILFFMARRNAPAPESSAYRAESAA